jgi:uncharacterized lipoprotein YddW (UPF0748 family)
MKRPSVIWIIICSVCIIGAAAASGAMVFLRPYDAVIAVGTHESSFSDSSMSVSINSASYSAVPTVPAVPFRAVWITTVKNTDFPSKPGLSMQAQKKEIDAIIDKSKSVGLTTVILQVRPHADALYKSQYFPWSAVLTGTQGVDPGYDPLKYFIDSAHSRGLKFEAWINPYRVHLASDTSSLAAFNPAAQHPDWTLKGDDGGLYFNPGLPQTKQLIEDGVMEIVNNYDVDGIVFDDYFYPDTKVDDAAAYKQYGGGLPIGDWRRNNVTAVISDIHSRIGNAKKNVVFGVSSFGVWANKSSNPAGSDTQAHVQSYYDQYADTRLWVHKGYVDYICPQIYWKIGYDLADYSKVLQWWVNTCKGTNVSLYIGFAVYKVKDESWPAQEIINQLRAAVKYPEYKGDAFYGYSDICANTNGISDALTNYYESTG